MKQELVDFKDVISSLQLLSKKVVPLPQRKSKLKSKILVEPVCSYKNMQVSLIWLNDLTVSKNSTSLITVLLWCTT